MIETVQCLGRYCSVSTDGAGVVTSNNNAYFAGHFVNLPEAETGSTNPALQIYGLLPRANDRILRSVSVGPWRWSPSPLGEDFDGGAARNTFTLLAHPVLRTTLRWLQSTTPPASGADLVNSHVIAELPSYAGGSNIVLNRTCPADHGLIALFCQTGPWAATGTWPSLINQSGVATLHIPFTLTFERP